jgi:hypothetical protein
MTFYDPDEQRRQLRRDRVIEAIAALCGLAGAWLLATKSEHAAWGWWAFLASNVGWIAFGWIRRHWFLLLQQAGFMASSLWGIWRWSVGT